METTVTVERLENEEEDDFLPSHEILRENLKAGRQKRPPRKSIKHKCKICYQVFDTKSDLDTHLDTHDPETPYECTKCDHKTHNKKYLARHIRTVHKKELYKEECRVCGKRFCFKTLLEKHMRVHTGEKPNKCDVCGKAFNSMYSLKTHKLIHANRKPYKCAYCDYACRDSSSLRKHQNVHLGISQRYPCVDCPRRFDTKARLQEHIDRIHRGIEPELEPCPICGAGFRSKQGMRLHVKGVHERSTTCVCGICGRHLARSSNLRTHMRTHLDMRPYRCTHYGCDKSYKDRGSLKKHARIHYPEQQFICDECGKNFTRKHRLILHLAQHTNTPRVKNTECMFCKARFYNKNYLLVHLRKVHGKRNKVMCDMCGFEANSKAGLTVHIRYIHVDTDKKCHVCGKRFKRKINLFHHYRNRHRISFEEKNVKPMVVIKQEPLESPGLEIDLLDIDKEEPFAGFDVDPDYKQDFKMPSTLAFNSSEEIGGIEVDKIDGSQDAEQNNLEEETIPLDKPASNIDEQNKEESTMIMDEENIDEPQSQSSSRTIPAAEFENFMSNYNMQNGDELEDTSTAMNSIDNTQLESGPRTTQADDFVENVISNSDIQKDNTEVDSKSQIYGRITMQMDEYLQDDFMNSRKRRRAKSNAPSTEIKRKKKKSKSGRRTMQVEEFLQHVMSDTDIQTRNKSKSSSTISSTKNNEMEMKSGQTMQVDEFLQHVMSDADLQVQDIDEETEKSVTKQIEELIEKSNLKNGIPKRTTWYGRKVEKVQVDAELTNLLFKDVNLECNGERITQKEEKREKIKETKEKVVKKKKRKKPNRFQDQTVDDDDLKDSKKVQYNRKNKSKSYYKKELNKERDDDIGTEEKHECEEASNITKKKTTGIKFNFTTQQCYVCFKLFQSKPELIEHCKEHFDVCNEVTLKKCPLCPFVTHSDIKRHMRLIHNVKINFSFMRIKDKKVNDNGSRYYFDVDNDKIKELEIIPSVKILNKKASMELDKRNREKKDKSLLKRKLVRKGKEWIVETETIDVSNHVVPKLKEKDNYLTKMKMLSDESKKNKVKMLFPCNNCDKLCQNLSALTLHMRRHDPNAKPFKKKVWKHKTGSQAEKTDEDKITIHDASNRDAKPKPIVNKHKCDPKLKAFYENNIKGGDIEFWQFLKIYNKMDRENVNDFKELESRTDFGIHFEKYDDIPKNTNENNNQDETSKNSSDLVNNTSNTEISSNKESVTSKTISNRRIKKIKFVRKIQLSKEEYKKRCELKNKLREKLAKK